MRLTGNCRMTNHFLMLLWPHEEGGLSGWMLWLMTSYFRRYDRHSKGSGHVCPVRFKGFPVQSDEHDLMVLRYQERNPLRQRCEAFSFLQRPFRPTRRGGIQSSTTGRNVSFCDPPVCDPPQDSNIQSLQMTHEFYYQYLSAARVSETTIQPTSFREAADSRLRC